jgi:DTW domain-containing protein YfiP
MREHCLVCHYPLSTCLCATITEVSSAIKVSILQDPIESKHAKNTARLAPLLLPHAQIYIGLIESDFAPLIEKTKQAKRNLLVYPSADAKPLGNQHSNCPYDHIIILDGTWRKARKLWLNNPWLHNIDACEIKAEAGSQYHIRKAPNEQSLSTLEAIAWTLHTLESCNIEPFFKALEGLQTQWLKQPFFKANRE